MKIILFVCCFNRSCILGSPNEPDYVPVIWPLYESKKKSYINFHNYDVKIEENFFEDSFQFWNLILHTQVCKPFLWYQKSLLIGIFVLILVLLSIYIFYNAKRSRRNIKPTETPNSDVVTTYHFLPTVVS
jgi:hypothetical protein